MQITHLSQAEFQKSYGILCASQSGSLGRDALIPTFCKIQSGGKTHAHAHFEPEVFYIISGTGTVRIKTDSKKISSGSLVQIPSEALHEIENTGLDDLTFISIYTEELSVLPLPEKILVTAAPPTPNGPLHLGHISGPYLAADVQRRYFALRRRDVKSVCGTDDHQNYVAAARPPHLSLQQFSQAMRSRILKGLGCLQIEFDEFLSPQNDMQYQARVQEFAARAIELGVIKADVVDFPYCENCDQFLVDAWIQGRCPNCHSQSHGGCEGCGWVATPFDLKAPHCSQCRAPAQSRRQEVHTFEMRLSEISADLDELELTPRLKTLRRQLERHAPFKVLVSVPKAHGIPLSTAHLDLHVWFEMAAAYENFALREDQSWVHCFGFDNSFYYVFFIPALLRAMNPKARLPDAIVTNEFLHLNGEKFSTSRNHAIWADEFSADSDLLRLYLCSIRPALQTENFTKDNFDQFALRLQAQLTAIRTRAQEVSVEEGVNLKDLQVANDFTRDIERFLHPKSLDMRRACHRLLEFIDVTIQAKNDGQREAFLIRELIGVMAPFLPKTAKDLAIALGIGEPRWP